MRVTLAAYGGLAAGINRHRAPRAVDTGELPAAQARELDRLVDAALGAGTHRPAGSGPAPDAMSYRITVQRDGATSTLTGSDTAASAEFADLVAWLQAHAGQ
jgi:hypothetical protein